MEKLKDSLTKRTQQVLLYDKLCSPASIKQALKLEIYGALKEFLDIDKEDIKLIISVSQNGKYKFDFSVETNNIKTALVLP